MDRENLENAAYQSACGNTDYKQGFKSGAVWLMNQPLSERLTEDEKKGLRELYNFTKKGIEVNNPDVSRLARLFAYDLTHILDIDIFHDECMDEEYAQKSGLAQQQSLIHNCNINKISDCDNIESAYQQTKKKIK